MSAAKSISYPHIFDPAGGSVSVMGSPPVRVAQIVMDYLGHGYSAEEICRQYPHLSLAAVHAAMGYYFDHREEIDRQIAQELTQADRDLAQSPPSPFLTRMWAEGRL